MIKDSFLIHWTNETLGLQHFQLKHNGCVGFSEDITTGAENTGGKNTKLFFFIHTLGKNLTLILLTLTVAVKTRWHHLHTSSSAIKYKHEVLFLCYVTYCF